MPASLSAMVSFGIPAIIFVLASCTKAEITAVNSMNRTDVFEDYQLKLIEGIEEGVIVVAEPEDACSSISGPPAHLPTSLNSFVLINGDVNYCFYDVQVKHAMEAGYSAAVIYLSTMYLSHEDQWRLIYIEAQNISTVVVSKAAGNTIKSYYLYNNDPESRLFIHQNGSNLLSLALLFGLIAGILAILALLFVVIKCMQLHRRRQQGRLTRRRLRHLQTIKYTSGGPYATCAICLEDYKEKDILRLLPCSHAYHRKCIDPWLISTESTCPVCKQVVIFGDSQCDSESASHTEGIAETAPLLQTAPGRFRRGIVHGTFVNVPVSVSPISGTYQTGSGEGTSRDAPSEALDEEDCAVSDQFRPSSSAPTVLMVTSDSPDGHDSYKDENATPSPHAVAEAFEGSNNEPSPSASMNEGKSRLIV